MSAIVLMAPYAEKLSPEELAKVDVPVLVVSSTGDTSTPIETNTVPVATLVPGRPWCGWTSTADPTLRSPTPVRCAKRSLATRTCPRRCWLSSTSGYDACAPGVLDSR